MLLKLVWLRRVVIAAVVSTCLVVLPGEAGVGGVCADGCVGGRVFNDCCLRFRGTETTTIKEREDDDKREG